MLFLLKFGSTGAATLLFDCYGLYKKSFPRDLGRTPSQQEEYFDLATALIVVDEENELNLDCFELELDSDYYYCY